MKQPRRNQAALIPEWCWTGHTHSKGSQEELQRLIENGRHSLPSDIYVLASVSGEDGGQDTFKVAKRWSKDDF
eukprot:3736690-Karenia_brevis.AAC.1